MVGVGECDGLPVMWRLGAYFNMAQSVNITMWSGQACDWCQATG